MVQTDYIGLAVPLGRQMIYHFVPGDYELTASKLPKRQRDAWEDASVFYTCVDSVSREPDARTATRIVQTMHDLRIRYTEEIEGVPVPRIATTKLKCEHAHYSERVWTSAMNAADRAAHIARYSNGPARG